MPTPKVYSFAGTTAQGKDLFELDFKVDLSITLQKLVTYSKGRPVSAVYYESYDPATGTYTNPICRLDWTFTDDSIGQMTRKQILLRHYNDDESLTDVIKDLGRSYDPIVDRDARFKESSKRRQILLDNTNGAVLRVMGYYLGVAGITDPMEAVKLGQDLLQKHARSIHLFVDDANYKLLTDLAQCGTPWLQQEMRDPVTLAPLGMRIVDWVISELAPAS